MISGVQEACRCPAVRADPHPRRDALIRRTGSLNNRAASSRQPRPPMHDSSPAGAYGHRRRFANDEFIGDRGSWFARRHPYIRLYRADTPRPSRNPGSHSGSLRSTFAAGWSRSTGDADPTQRWPARRRRFGFEPCVSLESGARSNGAAVDAPPMHWHTESGHRTRSSVIFDRLPRSTCLRALVHWGRLTNSWHAETHSNGGLDVRMAKIRRMTHAVSSSA